MTTILDTRRRKVEENRPGGKGKEDFGLLNLFSKAPVNIFSVYFLNHDIYCIIFFVICT